MQLRYRDAEGDVIDIVTQADVDDWAALGCPRLYATIVGGADSTLAATPIADVGRRVIGTA